MSVAEVDYISKEELPEFACLDYEKEPDKIPVVDPDYDSIEVDKLLDKEECALLEGWDIEDVAALLLNKKMEKMMSSEVWKNALSPRERPDLTTLRESENQEYFYITDNQKNYKIFSGFSMVY